MHAGDLASVRDRLAGRGVVLPATAYAAAAVVFRNEPRHTERALFTLVNDGPDWHWLRVPQQLGTPWVLPGLGVAFLVSGRRRDAVIAATALPLVKGLEVATKKVLRRPRPVYSTPTELRDDAPVEGPSFPSGHLAIATAATLLVARHSPWPVAVALGAAAALTAYVRVNQGAHHPSDALGGVFLGCAVVRALDAVVPATG